MDIQRRGQPQIGQPEFEQAGALAARGGGELSPDVIQQHKSAIQATGQQWQLGSIDFSRFGKEIHDRGWRIALDVDPTGRAAYWENVLNATWDAMDKAKAHDPEWFSKAAKDIVAARVQYRAPKTAKEGGVNVPHKEIIPIDEALDKIGQKVMERMKIKGKSIKLIDPMGTSHIISLETEGQPPP
jgi:hypothetical protein